MNASKFPASVFYVKFLTFLAYLVAAVGTIFAMGVGLRVASDEPLMGLVAFVGGIIGVAFTAFTLKFFSEAVQVFLAIEANTAVAARLAPPPLPRKV